MERKKLTAEAAEDLVRRIERIPMSELPRIFDEVNSGKWSAELGEPPVKLPSLVYSNFILQEIKGKCGFKAVWRYKKIEKEGYTPQMFEDWWESNLIYEPLHELHEGVGEDDSCGQGEDGKNHANSILPLLLGITFVNILCVFISLCT